MNSEEIKQLVVGFEDGSYPESKWTHHSHIYMAVWYLRRFSRSEASLRIKEGIKAFNLSKGGKNTDSSGYHETITEFYIRILNKFLDSYNEMPEEDLWNEIANQSFMKSDFPFIYYSKTYLMSTEARLDWMEPDKRPISDYESTLPV